MGSRAQDARRTYAEGARRWDECLGTVCTRCHGGASAPWDPSSPNVEQLPVAGGVAGRDHARLAADGSMEQDSEMLHESVSEEQLADAAKHKARAERLNRIEIDSGWSLPPGVVSLPAGETAALFAAHVKSQTR